MARVIIIDDNDTMREGMAVTLKKSGHEVLAFRNGLDGLAAYAPGIDSKFLSLLSIPAVVVLVWLAVRRLRNRVHRAARD